MAIVHDSVVIHGDKGTAANWNADHVIQNGTILGVHLEDPLTGAHEFAVFPTTPNAAPAADLEVANKKYVDDNVSNSITSSGRGNTNAGGWTTIGTHSFAAGELSTGSMVIVNSVITGTNGEYRIEISHAAGNIQGVVLATSGSREVTHKFIQQIGQADVIEAYRYDSAGDVLGTAGIIGALVANFMDDAWELRIQLRRLGGDTPRVNWGVIAIK